MPNNERRNTQLPPRGQGDRIYHVHTAEVEFAGGVGPWKIGRMYTISGAGGPTMMVHSAWSPRY
jgi:hypothetical protein